MFKREIQDQGNSFGLAVGLTLAGLPEEPLALTTVTEDGRWFSEFESGCDSWAQF